MIWQALLYDIGQHSRRINAQESKPRSLDMLGDEGRTALEWTLETLRQFGIGRVLYLGDYHIEKVLSRFPDLKVQYVVNSSDDIGYEVISKYHLDNSPLLLISASTILLPGALEKLTSGKAVYGVDSKGQSLGVFAFTEDILRDFHLRKPDSLTTFFQNHSIVKSINLDGLAALTTDQEAVAKTIFRGKAQTLDNLAPLIRDAVFLPRERFTLTEWTQNKTQILLRITNAFSPSKVVVRSSVVGEDGLKKSFAGQYLSVLNVASDDLTALAVAIDQVIDSYCIQARDLLGDDEVLIQPQVIDVLASGVLLTRDPRAAGPYFVINEDRQSGRSDSVTAGDTNSIIQQYIAWSDTETPILNEETRRLIRIARQLMSLSCLDALDIEYIIDRHCRIYILQVRPLAAASGRDESVDADLLDMLDGAINFVNSQMTSQSGLSGKKTVFGVMPDWNPAEMIGLSPRPLALSLYQKLVGESAWAEARALIGYRDVRPEALIISLAGRPFVDLRASLNSLLPASLDAHYAEVWVDHCLAMISADKSLHDKIEFDVAITCLSPNWPLDQRRLREAGLNPEDLRTHLQRLTQSIISEERESIDDQFVRLAKMTHRREQLLLNGNHSLHSLSRQLVNLTQDCQNLGIVSFAVLARYAFISMNFLRGFVNSDVISQADYDDFLRAVPTVAGEITQDLRSNQSIDLLISRYGHLRPNSYEITAPNYASDPEHFFSQHSPPAMAEGQPSLEDILFRRHASIDACCSKLGLNIAPSDLIDFISRSIQAREKGKFEFMKNVNAILETASMIGQHLDLDKDQISFLTFADLQSLQTKSIVNADRIQLKRRSANNEKRWRVTKAIHLPDVIVNSGDVRSFNLESWRANFITHKKVTGPIVWVDETPKADLAGAIVAIRAADPGYDWIFAHPIIGLITEFGGVASHMSIRAAEFGLPAAIGCGSVLFERLRGARRVELDASSEKIKVLL